MRIVAIGLSLALAAGMTYLATVSTAWVQMSALMGVVLWFGKAILLLRHTKVVCSATPHRLLLFVLAWPGMDVRRFVPIRVRAVPPSREEWNRAWRNTAFGVGFLIGGALLRDRAPLLATWMGLAGLGYLVFFGFFLLVSVTFRAAGVDAQPLFRHPRQSENLLDLWGSRWNRGVHDLITDTVYAPLRKQSRVVAAIATFLVSGLLHELVLSVPARGGFGLPMVYFCIQAAGVAFILTPMGKRCNLMHGRRAWWYGAILSLGAQPLLFTVPFHRNVMMPLLQDIGWLLG